MNRTLLLHTQRIRPRFSSLLKPTPSTLSTLSTRIRAEHHQSYHLPPETHPHAATILSFPSQHSVPASHYTPLKHEIINLAATISAFEPVRLYTRPEDIPSVRSLLRARLEDSPQTQNQIHILPCLTNHCWARDTGPVYVFSSTWGRFAVDFGFCEWGGKNLDPAEQVDGEEWPIMGPERLTENAQFARRVIDSDVSPSPVTRVASRVRLEGGGIEVDGEGTLLATESSILCPVRNPGLPKGDVERELQRVLGVRKLIWFPGRRGLDITDCHVDAAVRFVRPGVVVVSRPFSQRRGLVSEWNEVYGEICEVLERETDALGRKLEVNVVEEPDPRFVVGGESVVSGEEGPAASYVNFYFVNGGIVVPVFGDPVADEAAVEMFQRLVPERVVRTVRVNAMPRMGGVLHCVTQQVPLSGAS